MATWTAQSFTDLVNSTLPAIRKDKLNDIATDLRRYHAAQKLLKMGGDGPEWRNRKIRGGLYYPVNYITAGDDNARNIGFFEPGNFNQTDGTIAGQVGWRFLRTGAVYDRKQALVNSDENAIFDFIGTKEYQMEIGFVNLVEANVWDGPSGSTDDKTPFGFLKYWLAYNATTGFYGGNHASFTSGPAGLSATTYTRLKHYTAQYTTVDDADLVAKMFDAINLTGFMGIPNKPIKGDASDNRNLEIDTTYDTWSALYRLLEAKSDGVVRKDLVLNNGQVMFWNLPVIEVPYLTANHSTSDPVMILDWSDIAVVGLSGADVDQTYREIQAQPGVFERYKERSANIVMHNRRRQTLIAKSDPMSD